MGRTRAGQGAHAADEEVRTRHDILLYTLFHTYDEQGLRRESLRAWSDGDSDLTVRTFDSQGRLLTETTDLGADGRIDQRLTQRWQEKHRASWILDLDGDSRPEIRGQLVHTTTGYIEHEDLNGDGTPDRSRYYNHEGTLLREAFLEDGVTLLYQYVCY